MLKKLVAILTKDERGAETLEYIAVGAAIVALALLVYPGNLQAGINAVIADITAKLVAL